jgi:hypothetical protein
MALARFFDRVYAAAGRHLAVDRTSLEAALGDRVVAVHCGPEVDTGADGPRWVAELLVNLLARLYPRIALTAPDGARLQLEQLAHTINPSVEFVDAAAPAATTVVVGNVEAAPSGALHPRADGWVARLLRAPDPRPWGPANPYAAAAAATFAASEVFRGVFRDRIAAPPLMRDVHLSLLDFGEEAGADRLLAATNLGPVAFLGLGAVCNAALWAVARHAGLEAQGWLVDPEAVDLSNLQRYLLTGDADVGRPKTELALRALAGTGLALQPRLETLEAFADSFPESFAVPIVCVSVDNVAGRRAAQALLPRLLVNGWTGDGGLGASWHEFDRDAACLACFYHPHRVGLSQTELVADALGLERLHAAELWVKGLPPNEIDLRTIAKHLGAEPEALAAWRGRPLNELYTGLICGAAGVDLRGRGHAEAVPLAHQSALAGVLLAAELVKRSDAELATLAQPEPLVAWDDVLQPPPRQWRRARPRESGCICGDADYQEVYRAKWR